MTTSVGNSLVVLADRALLSRTRRLVRSGCELEAELLVHLSEIERRRLYAARGHPSLFKFCVDELGFSEDVACARIRVARLARQRPEVLDTVRTGRVHLSGLRLLAPHLEGPDAPALLEEAAGRSKRAIEQIVARVAPKPDAPATVRRLPTRRAGVRGGDEATAMGVDAAGAAGASAGAPGASSGAPGGPGEAADGSADAADGSAGAVGVGTGATGRVAGGAAASHGQSTVAPLSPGRYKVQFTADQLLHDKLREAQALLSHQVGPRDLAGLFDRALTCLIAETQKMRFGVGRKPRGVDGRRGARKVPAERGARSHPDSSVGRTAGTRPEPAASLKAAGAVASAAGVAGAGVVGPQAKIVPPPASPSRHIPDAIKREVFLRDGGRCAFVSAAGRRCGERHHLAFHHLDGFARTGEHHADRIALRCRAHNQYEADVMFGSEFMGLRRRGIRPGTDARATGLQGPTPRDEHTGDATAARVAPASPARGSGNASDAGPDDADPLDDAGRREDAGRAEHAFRARDPFDAPSGPVGSPTGPPP